MTADDPRAWCDQVDARTNATEAGPWHIEPDLDEFGDDGIPLVLVTGDGLIDAPIPRSDADARWIASARTDLPAATTALRAVLDLHRPQAPGGNLVGDDFCHGCWEAGGCDAAPLYPCPTVTVITTALEDA